MQKFLSLIIALGILYYMIDSRSALKPDLNTGNKFEVKEDTETIENEPVTGNYLEKTLSTILVNVLKTEEGKRFFENILQPQKSLMGSENSLNQGFKINNIHFVKSLFNIETFGEGVKGPASCGHIVTITYQITDLKGLTIENDTKTITLGTKKIIPGLDSIVVGMLTGQKRNAIVPAKYAFSSANYRRKGIDPDAPYKVSIVLKEILPANFAKESEVRMFDDEIGYKAPLLCGDFLNFDVRITKLSSGEILFDTNNIDKKMSFKIGDITYPMIFSHALFGKIPIGNRTVISKGSTFYSFGFSTSKIFPKNPLPPNEYYMLELSNFETQE